MLVHANNPRNHCGESLYPLPSEFVEWGIVICVCFFLSYIYLNLPVLSCSLLFATLYNLSNQATHEAVHLLCRMLVFDPVSLRTFKKYFFHAEVHKCTSHTPDSTACCM